MYSWSFILFIIFHIPIRVFHVFFCQMVVTVPHNKSRCLLFSQLFLSFNFRCGFEPFERLCDSFSSSETLLKKSGQIPESIGQRNMLAFHPCHYFCAGKNRVCFSWQKFKRCDFMFSRQFYLLLESQTLGSPISIDRTLEQHKQKSSKGYTANIFV